MSLKPKVNNYISILLAENGCQWRAQDLFEQGQKKIFWGAEKKSGGADSRPKGAKKISAPPVLFSAPPAEFNSAPGAGQTRGGAENLFIPRERQRNI